MQSQILTIFNIRRKISDNVQDMLNMHEQFLVKLQTASPMSALHAQRAGDLELTSRGISKRLSTNLGSLRGFQQRSLRSRTMKASVNQRLRALTADPAEALDVARNIAELVSVSVCNLSIPTLTLECSLNSSLHMTNTALTMSSSRMMSLFCAGNLPNGQSTIEESRQWPNRLHRQRDAIKMTANQ